VTRFTRKPKKTRLTSLADVGDIVILQIQDSLGVLDNSRGVGGNEEFDGLGKPILRQESSRLRSSELGFTASARNGQQSTAFRIVRDCVSQSIIISCLVT